MKKSQFIKFKFLNSNLEADDNYGEVKINLKSLIKNPNKWKIDDVFLIKKNNEVTGSVYIQAMLTKKRWNEECKNINKKKLEKLGKIIE